jgi:hypothetical protein
MSTIKPFNAQEIEPYKKPEKVQPRKRKERKTRENRPERPLVEPSKHLEELQGHAMYREVVALRQITW